MQQKATTLYEKCRVFSRQFCWKRGTTTKCRDFCRKNVGFVWKARNFFLFSNKCAIWNRTRDPHFYLWILTFKHLNRLRHLGWMYIRLNNNKSRSVSIEINVGFFGDSSARMTNKMSPLKSICIKREPITQHFVGFQKINGKLPNIFSSSRPWNRMSGIKPDIFLKEHFFSLSLRRKYLHIMERERSYEGELAPIS